MKQLFLSHATSKCFIFCLDSENFAGLFLFFIFLCLIYWITDIRTLPAYFDMSREEMFSVFKMFN